MTNIYYSSEIVFTDADLYKNYVEYKKRTFNLKKWFKLASV